jgi:hypothetical protein
MWHRPYMQCFEILLQHYDPCKNDPTFEHPLAAHSWRWDTLSDSEKLPDWAVEE